ncbi:MAG: hypothetical protein NTX98_01605 [Candidatus Doudnabacteria bacterium]|nr:hypothetical protein [Candidatus Doudnabacteria bacterium]
MNVRNHERQFVSLSEKNEEFFVYLAKAFSTKPFTINEVMQFHQNKQEVLNNLQILIDLSFLVFDGQYYKISKEVLNLIKP